MKIKAVIEFTKRGRKEAYIFKKELEDFLGQPSSTSIKTNKIILKWDL
jgi:hypothetical protein